MGLEAGNGFITGLVATNPVGATDPKSQGDDHLRLIKAALLGSFPNIGGAVTATHTELNKLAGCTAVTADLSALHGGTLTAANASNLTNLTAANLTGSHTLPDGVLSTNVPLLNAANAFSSGGPQSITSTGQYLALNTTNANGGYISFARNGAITGYLGDDKAVAGGTLDDIALEANGGALRLYGTGGVYLAGVASTDFARLSQSNTFTGASLTVSNASSPYVQAVDTTNSVTTVLWSQDTSGFLGTSSNHSLSLLTNGTTALTISTSQNFDFKGGTVTTNNASASEVGYKGLPQNSQSVSYTTVLADANKNLHQTGASKTFTIDSNANVAFPVGTVLNFTCDNATGVSIAITSDTLRLAGTATTGTRTLAQYGIATAIKILSTTWIISGQGLT